MSRDWEGPVSCALLALFWLTVAGAAVGAGLLGAWLFGN